MAARGGHTSTVGHHVTPNKTTPKPLGLTQLSKMELIFPCFIIMVSPSISLAPTIIVLP